MDPTRASPGPSDSESPVEVKVDLMRLVSYLYDNNLKFLQIFSLAKDSDEPGACTTVITPGYKYADSDEEDILTSTCPSPLPDFEPSAPNGKKKVPLPSAASPGPSAPPPPPKKAPLPSKLAAKTPAPPAQPKPVSVPSPGPSAQTPPQPAPPAREAPIVILGSNSETSPASSEVDDDFIPVQSKSQKRKLKESKSHANPAKKVGITPTPPAPSTSQGPTSATQATPEEESQDSPMEEYREKIPPLFIREKLSWQRILPLLDRQAIAFTSARSTAIGIRVQCPTSDDHRRLTKTLRQENVGFHTYALPDERVLRVVIRGLPRELDTEVIKEDLISQELPVREVHRMYNSRTKRPYDMVLVILDLTHEGKQIHKITTVCRLSGLKVEPPHTNGRMGQCHRCQLYGHSARNCFAHPRCVKCLGDHGTSDCPRKQPTEEPPSCVLCRTQGHPANYRGCPRAPKETKRRVKPAAPQPTAPAPTFVPAPAPTTSAWEKPLPRVTLPAPTPIRAPAAPPAKPVQQTAPMPPPPPSQPSLGTPSQATAADRAPGNLKYLRYILASIDVERMDRVVSDLRANALSALEQHWEYLLFIDSLQKTAP